MGYLYRLILSLVLSTALAALAAWREALTRGGLIWAWCLAVVVTFCGGLGGFAALAATFLFTILAGKLSKTVREPIETRLHAKTGPRDAYQVICNVLVGAVMLLLLFLTGQYYFVWACGGAMAASLADSMASELGVLSKRAPRDILTLRPAEKGLSGAVSLSGLGASLGGAAIIAAICAYVWGWGRGAGLFLDVAAAGFLAALCDSVLGSALQAKYRCGVCGALTERKRHCGKAGTLEKGLPFVTNDVVNLCNNLIGAGAALALYFIMGRA